MRINWLQWNFFYGFTCQRQSLPVAFHQILAFATVTFGNRTLQFCEGTIARQNLRQMEKAICMTVLIRAARPHSRAIFAALIT